MNPPVKRPSGQRWLTAEVGLMEGGNQCVWGGEMGYSGPYVFATQSLCLQQSATIQTNFRKQRKWVKDMFAPEIQITECKVTLNTTDVEFFERMFCIDEKISLS